MPQRRYADCCVGSDRVFRKEKDERKNHERQYAEDRALEYPHIRLLICIVIRREESAQLLPSLVPPRLRIVLGAISRKAGAVNLRRISIYIQEDERARCGKSKSYTINIIVIWVQE